MQQRRRRKVPTSHLLHVTFYVSERRCMIYWLLIGYPPLSQPIPRSCTHLLRPVAANYVGRLVSLGIKIRYVGFLKHLLDGHRGGRAPRIC
jgi:hypothetical protein